MRSPEHRIDSAMQSFAKNWMKSIDRPRVSTTLGYFFISLFILFWSSSLSTYLGIELNERYRALIFIAVGLTLMITIIVINRIMVRIGIERSVRSAIFFSSVVGPYVNLTTNNYWNLPVISHLAGFFASILTFIISFLLDTALQKSPKRASRLDSDQNVNPFS